MAGVKKELLAGVAASMNDTVMVRREPSGSLVRQTEGRRRLDTACVIRLDRIIADPNQPRTEFDPDALVRLAESLKTRGQLQPIRVRWDDVNDRYVVVVGERRWRAAQLAGLDTLACVVVTGDASPTDFLEDQLVENCLREDLRPIEQARAYRSVIESRGLTVRALAERLQISHGTIVRALALLGLPEGVQESVERGELGAAVAYELTKIVDGEELAEMAKAATRGGLKRDEVRSKVTKPRKAKCRGARKITARMFRTSPGPRVTVEFGAGADNKTGACRVA